jgi:hypothetical protein
MFRIFGIILIAVGVYLITIGVSRRDSIAGHVDSAATNVENSVNGGTASPPKHAIYIGVGGVLVLVGAATALRRKPVA